MRNLILAITNPRKFFESNKEEHGYVLPMILILVIVGVCSALSLYALDFESMAELRIAEYEQELLSMGQTQDEISAELEQVRQASASEPDGMLLFVYLIFDPLLIYVLILLWTIYFKIVASVMNLGGRFRDWYAFVWWTRVPIAIGAIVTLVGNFLLNPSSLADLNILSFSNLLDLQPTVGLGQLLSTFDLISVWIIIVAGIGFSAWTNKPLGSSILITALPVVLLFALALLFGTV